jgi:hypothetical protein
MVHGAVLNSVQSCNIPITTVYSNMGARKRGPVEGKGSSKKDKKGAPQGPSTYSPALIFGIGAGVMLAAVLAVSHFSGQLSPVVSDQPNDNSAAAATQTQVQTHHRPPTLASLTPLAIPTPAVSRVHASCHTRSL